MKNPSDDGKVLYFNYSGGYTNLHMWQSCLELSNTHAQVYIKLGNLEQDQ